MSQDTKYRASIYKRIDQITDRIPVGYFFALTFDQILYFANYFPSGTYGKKTFP